MASPVINIDFNDFPQSWNSLKPNHIKLFARLFLIRAGSMFTVLGNETYIKDKPLFTAAYLKMVGSIKGIPEKIMMKFSIHQANILHDEWSLLKFMFSGSDLTINPFPRVVIWVGWRRFVFYAPIGDFRTFITADEFRFVDGWYSLYKQTNEIKYLDNLLAVLYRCKQKKYNSKNPAQNGDCREPFNNYTADWRIPIMSRIPLDIKLSIALWFEGCRALLPKKHPGLFTGENEGEANRHGWTAVFVNHAGPELGTQDNIKKMILSDLLTSLEIRIEEARNLKEKLKQKTHR